MGSDAVELEQEHAEYELEYELLSKRAGLIDRSGRGRLALTGSQAAEFLNGQVSNDVGALHAGEGCYATFLTHKGKMLGDLRVLAVGDEAGDDEAEAVRPVELLLETERVSLQALFDMIRRFKIGYDVELEKRTLESSLLSVVGPMARDVVARATGDGGDGTSALPADVEHRHVAARIASRPVRLIATAAPDGLDVLCDSGDREAVEAALLSAGAERASEAAAEIVRIEHGRPRYGVDLDDSVIPQEAGLNERAVSFEKGCYVGQETVARLFYKGKPNRHLRGLRLSERVDAGAQLSLDGRPLGTLTSSAVSPALGPIGLALLRREAEPGTTLTVSAAGAVASKDGEGGATATVVSLPFGR